MNSHPASEIPDDERDIQPDFAPVLPQAVGMNGCDVLEKCLEGKPLDAVLEVKCEHRVIVKFLKLHLECRGYSFTVADKDPLTILARGKQRTEKLDPLSDEVLDVVRQLDQRRDSQ